MDVVLVGSYPPPHGGQSVHVENLARFLRSTGAHVQIVNTGANKIVRAEGVSNVASSWQLLRALASLPAPSIVHVHVSSPTDLHKIVPVGIAAAAQRTPWIVTVHSGDAAARLRAAGPLRRAVARALLRRAAIVVCVSAAIRDAVADLIGTDRVAVIAPHSIDLAAARTPPDVAGFVERHRPAITCVGQFEPTYGFDDAVRLLPEVLARFPAAGLLLIGNADQAEPCRSLIASLGLQDRVMLCGNLTHDECLGAMSESALFLRPTVYDGDALSVREALAMGLPVVATATDFRPEGVLTYRRDVPGDLAAKVLATLAQHDRNSARAGIESGNLEEVRRAYLRVVRR